MRQSFKLKKAFAVSLSLALLSLGACKKSKDDDDTSASESNGGGTSTPTNPTVQAEDVAGMYSVVAAQLGTLNITAYNTETALALTDEAWDEADWATTTRFNCFGECENGSISAKDYVGDAMDPEKSGPVGNVKKKLDVFCYLGAILSADDLGADGLPAVTEAKTLTIGDDTITRLVDSCGMEAADAEEFKEAVVNLTVTDPGNEVFDRYVDFAIGSGDEVEHNPFYLKNSDNIISVSMYEAETDGDNGTHGISRTMFKMDIATSIFQFEYFSRIIATGTTIQDGGSLSMSRGYRNAATGEIAYLSDMGSQYHELNHTFLALSGNENETQLGVYMARSAEDTTALAGSFVCVDKTDGTLINATGCTENTALDRKHEWSVSSDLFSTIAGSADADWELGETTEVANFDADTIFTLAPTFK